jgi:hypothetical protein
MDPVNKVDYHVIVVTMVLNTIALNPVKRNVKVRNSVNKSYKGSGAKSDNETSREVSKASWYKNNRTIELNDKYRAYKKTVPEGERVMTFLEFKESQRPSRKKFRGRKSQKSKSCSEPQKIKI